MIIDTAGRLGVDEELMKQARDIRDAVRPNEILFVIDAMIGQDAVKTAKAFDEGVDFTACALQARWRRPRWCRAVRGRP